MAGLVILAALAALDLDGVVVAEAASAAAALA